jgi:hypothetical protein
MCSFGAVRGWVRARTGGMWRRVRAEALPDDGPSVRPAMRVR